MIKVQQVTVVGDGDQAQVFIAVDDGSGGQCVYEYHGTVISSVTINNLGRLHLELTVTPTPLKRDNLPSTKFTG